MKKLRLKANEDEILTFFITHADFKQDMTDETDSNETVPETLRGVCDVSNWAELQTSSLNI